MISAAWPYVIALAGLAALLFYLQVPLAGGFFLLAAVAIGLFFRDPERAAPAGDDLILSPADGRVVEVARDPEKGSGRIAIFLSLFNVHVNRSPVAGRVRNVTYRPGAFRAAFARKASEENERNTLELDSPAGLFGVSQIAGLVARRIRCFKKAGDTVSRGERIGYIAFGSRTELTLPPGAEIRVAVGDSVRGGETIVAALPGDGAGAS